MKKTKNILYVLCALVCLMASFETSAIPVSLIKNASHGKHIKPFGKPSFKQPPLPSIKLPIVFTPKYDISLWGIEKILHHFDGCKYGKIAHFLEQFYYKQNLALKFYEPEKASDELLKTIHTPEYLNSLNNSVTVARVAEVIPLVAIPNSILQRKLLDPVRYGTGGTILSAQLAQKYGWSINLSGGYHHAKANKGEGFCFFADIPLAVKEIRKTLPKARVLIIDYDAHRGNGVEREVAADRLTRVFDVYNYERYPWAPLSDERVDYHYPVPSGTNDEEYLELIKSELPKAIAAFKPDFIIYNAGSDIYKKDPLGGLSVSKEAIIERDRFVFEQALGAPKQIQAKKIPIIMVLSGGYSKESYQIVSESIENLIKTFNLDKTVDPSTEEPESIG